MLAIAEEKYGLLSASLQKLFKIAKTSLLIILLLLTFIVAKGFYKEKIQFHDIFSHHKVYDWNFSRVHLKSTINTELIKENVDLIKEYSTGKGIYIISKYDNLLPFLSERYSLLPYFEMSWHLFSEKDTQGAVSKIEREKPGIIFVDTNISRYGYDPWAKIYSNKEDIKERASRFGRNAGLNKLFMQVNSHYEKIKEGSLISVYKRKTS